MARWTFSVVVLVLLVSATVLTACMGMPGGTGRRPQEAIDPEYEKFYTGREGVKAVWDSFPTKLYYYRESGNAYNEFEMSVEVRNEGASFAPGYLFLSGYDPNILQFVEQPIQTIGMPGYTGQGMYGCGMSVGSIGFGDIAGMFSCDGVSIFGAEGGNWAFDVQSMRNFMNGINADWWDNSKFDFGLSGNTFGDGWQGNIFFNLPNDFNYEYYGHGRMMIAQAGMFHDSMLSMFGRPYQLPGDTYEYPGGGIDYATYHGIINPAGWPAGLDQLKQSIMLTNCYGYTTYAAPLVCIDPDPYSDHQKVCTARSFSWSNSQGAPVAVTSVEQENTGRQAIFRINIQNVGRGEVFDFYKLTKCSPYMKDRVRAEDRDIIYIPYVRIGNVPLSCTPSGPIRLRNGRGTVTCAYDLGHAGMASAYETPLVMELWYGYSETEQRQLLIKRVT